MKSIKTCEITSLIEHTMELNIPFFVDQPLHEAQTKSTFLLKFTNGALKLQNRPIRKKKVRLLSSFHFFLLFSLSLSFFPLFYSFLLLMVGILGGMITLGIPPPRSKSGGYISPPSPPPVFTPVP